MVRKKKTIPKKHKFKINDRVMFRFAGRERVGVVTELTKEDTGHATYTVVNQGVIYPCLGLIDSKNNGNIISKV
jgi:hypothetical protein